MVCLLIREKEVLFWHCPKKNSMRSGKKAAAQG
jgi:hypothetical protein